MKFDPKILENDAIVVLCIFGFSDQMTHHEFKLRAAAMGFALTKSDCHNMLHRATGRVIVNGNRWRLTASGLEYRTHILETIQRILQLEVGEFLFEPTT